MRGSVYLSVHRSVTFLSTTEYHFDADYNSRPIFRPYLHHICSFIVHSFLHSSFICSYDVFLSPASTPTADNVQSTCPTSLTKIHFTERDGENEDEDQAEDGENPLEPEIDSSDDIQIQSFTSDVSYLPHVNICDHVCTPGLFTNYFASDSD